MIRTDPKFVFWGATASLDGDPSGAQTGTSKYVSKNGKSFRSARKVPQVDLLGCRDGANLHELDGLNKAVPTWGYFKHAFRNAAIGWASGVAEQVAHGIPLSTEIEAPQSTSRPA